jgi:purine nucleosidase
MDVDVSHGPSYGDTLTWTEKFKPATGVRLVHAQVDLDLPRFQKMFVDLMTTWVGQPALAATGSV